MRDPVLDEALRRLAAEAATRFSSLIACGEEVPFDVAENDGNDSFFYRYVPLTAKFVAEHEADLRSLPAYGPACGAINLAGAAVPYLETRGIPVPADPDERAGEMIRLFIAELWEGSAEFTLDRARLDAALAGIEAETRDIHEADLLVAPLAGLQMPVGSVELTPTVRVVRADTVDAPIEAMASEGMGRQAWEPQFLMLVDQGTGPEASEQALACLHGAIAAMRLFKSGAISLGPYAFAPVAEGHWRRVATRAIPVREGGGYVLSEAECEELSGVCGRLATRLSELAGAPAGPAGGDAISGSLSWALGRFEMGRERPDALQAMTDHLLALRAVLQGDGPVGAPLPVRAAALIADAPERDQAREKLEAGLRLERDLIAGEPASDSGALALALWIEDSVRQILLESVEGSLGADAGVAADESLLAAGLSEGEGSISQRGDTEEWDALPEPVDAGEAEPVGWRPFELHEPELSEAAIEEPAEAVAEGSVRRGEDDAREEVTRIMEPIPNFESEIRITAMREERGRDADEMADGIFDREIDSDAGFTRGEMVDDDGYGEGAGLRGPDGWLDEFGTIEWPAGAIRAYRGGDREEGEPVASDSFARERVDTPRVRHLFQVPDDADWTVRELDYDRRRSA